MEMPVPIPDFQSLMLPIMQVLSDGQERKMPQLGDELAIRFKLSDEDRKAMLPSGQQTVFNNRIGWAKTDLKHAGLIDNPTRGRVKISDLGRKVMAEKPTVINRKFLKQYPSYLAFLGLTADGND
jgi:restriction system protein